MEFDIFKRHIPTLSELPLGGIESQLRLAPKLREDSIKSKNYKDPKLAAVLALFFPDEHNETHFLLTLRAAYNGTHGAQISFPGGKYDSNDGSLNSTALRETEEEVGINTSDITLFKEMTNVYIPPSNFLVTPFLGNINYTPRFKVNHEVQEIINVPLKNLLDEAFLTTKKITTSYAKNIDVPCFKLNDHIVWGATAMMLAEIRDLFRII